MTSDEKSQTLIATFPLCYADDLLIVSSNREELVKSIRVLENWCKGNYIAVNTKKSAILTVNVPAERQIIKIHNTPIPIRESIKYLGFTLSNKGTWNEHIQQKINIPYGVFNQHRKILTSQHLPYNIKLRIADSKIFSHLRYGEEIFVLKSELIKKLQTCENNIIKHILNIPRATSSTGLMYILGRMATENRQKIQRLNNFCRLQRSEKNIFNKLFHNDKLNMLTFLPGRTYADVNAFSFKQKIRSKKSFIDSDIFTNSRKKKQTYKNVIKRYVRLENHEQLSRILTINNKDIIDSNSSYVDTDLLNNYGRQYDSLIHWRLGGTYQNHISYQSAYEFENTCPLC